MGPQHSVTEVDMLEVHCQRQNPGLYETMLTLFSIVMMVKLQIKFGKVWCDFKCIVAPLALTSGSKIGNLPLHSRKPSMTDPVENDNMISAFLHRFEHDNSIFHIVKIEYSGVMAMVSGSCPERLRYIAERRIISAR